MGAVGLPVFTDSAGTRAIFGTTGGYLAGFILTAFIVDSVPIVSEGNSLS